MEITRNPEIFTIGHGNLLASQIVELLKRNKITTLVDVRSSPYSAYCPQFNRESFSAYLKTRQVEYIFAGDKLGGRPTEPSCYYDGELPTVSHDYLHLVNYPEMMTRIWFQEGLTRLSQITNSQKTAIMCSEENPVICHRHYLVAQALMLIGFKVTHIRGNGNIIDAILLPKIPKRAGMKKKVDELQMTIPGL